MSNKWLLKWVFFKKKYRFVPNNNRLEGWNWQMKIHWTLGSNNSVWYLIFTPTILYTPVSPFYPSLAHYIIFLKEARPICFLKIHLCNYIYLLWKCISKTMVYSFRDIYFFFTIKYHLRINMIDEKKKMINVYLIPIFVSHVFILSLVFFKSYLKFYFHLIFIIL